MNDQFEQFASAIHGMYGCFGRNAAPETTEMWGVALRGLTPGQIETGITRAVQECKELPTPAVVRELATHSSFNENFNAWVVASNAVRHGTYKSLSFQDMAINATIRAMGGWSHFCRRFDRENEGFIERDFTRIYTTLVKRVGGVNEENGAPLINAGVHSRCIAIRCDYAMAHECKGYLKHSGFPKLEVKPKQEKTVAAFIDAEAKLAEPTGPQLAEPEFESLREASEFKHRHFSEKETKEAAAHIENVLQNMTPEKKEAS